MTETGILILRIRDARVVELWCEMNDLQAVLFIAFFDVTKHNPLLSAVNPFAQDPYDAIGSYGIQTAALLGCLSLIRAFRWIRSPTPFKTQQLLRTQLAVILSVIIPLAGDAMALVRHTSVWLGSAAGHYLLGLVVALFLLALMGGWLICRPFQGINPPTEPVPWRKAVLVCSGVLVVLALYPEELTRNVVGAPLTILAGAVFLFLPMSAILEAVFPLGRGISSRVLRRARYRWSIVALLGGALGLLAFVGDAVGEGMAHSLRKALYVASIYAGLDMVGMLIGYSLLKDTLALGHLFDDCRDLVNRCVNVLRRRPPSP